MILDIEKNITTLGEQLQSRIVINYFSDEHLNIFTGGGAVFLWSSFSSSGSEIMRSLSSLLAVERQALSALLIAMDCWKPGLWISPPKWH